MKRGKSSVASLKHLDQIERTTKRERKKEKKCVYVVVIDFSLEESKPSFTKIDTKKTTR